MFVIDAQLHEPALSLGRLHQEGDWQGTDGDTKYRLMLEVELAYMRAAGVDAAVLFPTDLAWGRYATARVPGRFSIVPMFGGIQLGGLDPCAPAIDEVVGELLTTPNVVGMRAVFGPGFNALEDFDAFFVECAKHELPVFVASSDPDGASKLAKLHPELTVVIDHMGVHQPPNVPLADAPWEGLGRTLDLAALPNVVVKMSGAPTLSHEGYPFADVWPHLHRLLDAYGVERLMWGTDISRVIGWLGFSLRITAEEFEATYHPHSYAEALHFVRETSELSPSEKELILGENAKRILHWNPSGRTDGGW